MRIVVIKAMGSLLNTAPIDATLQCPPFHQICFMLTSQNLLTQAPTANLPSLFTSQTLALITSLQARKWSDEEIEDDLTYLSTELKSRLEGLTTYDEYMSELDSGKLIWSPTHESEDFWKENGARLGQEEGGRGVK